MYSQPTFYKFSEDSTQLAAYASKLYQDNMKDLSILDLCSGCGVIGIEFCQDNPNVKKLCLIEPQEDYKIHIEKNLELLDSSIETEVLIKPFDRCDFPKRFDLILSNPPYFLLGSGREPEDERKLKCHFISREDFKVLMVLAKNLLNKNGIFLFLGREDQEIIQEYLRDDIIKVEKKLSKSTIYSFINP